MIGCRVGGPLCLERGQCNSMNTLFLSDMHAGSPLFKNNTYLSDLINSDRYDRIVVVGDLIDTWEAPYYDIMNKKLSPIEAIKNSKKEIIIVMGNHDPPYDSLCYLFPNAIIVEDFVVIDDVLITHGHEFDVLIMKYSVLARYLNKLNWVFERVGINLKAFFRTLFYSVASKINNDYYSDLVYNIMEKVVIKYGADNNFIVTGHTHMPMIASHIDYPNITYINCGDWVHNFSYVEYIDGMFFLKKLM